MREPGELAKMRSRLNGKLWQELSEEEHQRFPGDYEAQVSQGPIAAHSEEHLGSTDQGLLLLRRDVATKRARGELPAQRSPDA